MENIKVPTEKKALQLADEWAQLQIELKEKKDRKAAIEAELGAYVVENEVSEVGCLKAYTRAAPAKLVTPPGRRGELAVASLIDELEEVYVTKKLNTKEIAVNFKMDAGLRKSLRAVGVKVEDGKESLHFKYLQKN